MWKPALIALPALVLFAEQPGHSPLQVFRTAANEVLVTADVIDPQWRFITGLRKRDFRLFENGREQTIASVTLESAPVSVAIILDESGSMAGGWNLARQSLRRFMQDSGSGDEFALITVRGKPFLTSNFDADPERISRLIGRDRPSGSTALLDAVYLAATRLKQARGRRKAILVISDGKDNSSRYRKREVLNLLRESDLTLYAVAVNVGRPVDPNQWADTSGADLLGALADVTGGRCLEVAQMEDLPSAMRKIDIRFQYVLAYAPDPAAVDGRYHKVRVKLASTRRNRSLRVSSRPGYYAIPAESGEGN